MMKAATVKKSVRTGDKAKTKRGAKKLLSMLPESVEHIELVQQVAGVLEELQNRVLDVKAEASNELKKLMKLYENNYKGLEKKVHSVTLEAKKQAQTSMIHILQKWHEHKQKLPAPLASEIEKIINQIGAKMVATSTTTKKSAKKTTRNSSKAAPAAPSTRKKKTSPSTKASASTPKRTRKT